MVIIVGLIERQSSNKCVEKTENFVIIGIDKGENKDIKLYKCEFCLDLFQAVTIFINKDQLRTME